MEQKKIYSLYNQSLKKKLTHPKLGVLATNDLKEAQDMLASCHEFLEKKGLSFLIKDFIIVEI